MLTASLTRTRSDKTTATRRPSRGRRHQLTLNQYDTVVVFDFFFCQAGHWISLNTDSPVKANMKARIGETSGRPFSFGMKETPRCVPLLVLELEGNIVP